MTTGGLLFILFIAFAGPWLWQKFSQKFMTSTIPKKSGKRCQDAGVADEKGRHRPVTKFRLLWTAILCRIFLFALVLAPIIAILIISCAYGRMTFSGTLISCALILGFFSFLLCIFCRGFLSVSAESLRRLDAPEMQRALADKSLCRLQYGYKGCIDKDVFVIATSGQLIAFLASEINFRIPAERHRAKIYLPDSMRSGKHGQTVIRMLELDDGYLFCTTDGREFTIHADAFILSEFRSWFKAHKGKLPK